MEMHMEIYDTQRKKAQQNGRHRKTSSISRTQYQNLNVSCIPLQLSSLNLLKPRIKLRMKM